MGTIGDIYKHGDDKDDDYNDDVQDYYHVLYRVAQKECNNFNR